MAMGWAQHSQLAPFYAMYRIELTTSDRSSPSVDRISWGNPKTPGLERAAGPPRHRSLVEAPLGYPSGHTRGRTCRCVGWGLDVWIARARRAVGHAQEAQAVLEAISAAFFQGLVSLAPMSATPLLREVDDAAACRVCQCGSEGSEELLSPCLCKGSVRWVHRVCLDEWRGVGGRPARRATSCELCGSHCGGGLGSMAALVP